MKKSGSSVGLVAVCAAIVLCAVALLSGCGGGNALVGKWTATVDGIPITMEFQADGGYALSESTTGLSLKGSYTLDGSTLTRVIAGAQDVCTVAVDGKTLTLTGQDGSVTQATKG